MTNKDIIDQFLSLNLFIKFRTSIGGTTKANKSDGVVKKRSRKEDYYFSDQVDQSVKVDVIYLSRFLKWRDSFICAKYQISIETFKKIKQKFNDSYKQITYWNKIENSSPIKDNSRLYWNHQRLHGSIKREESSCKRYTGLYKESPY